MREKIYASITIASGVAGVCVYGLTYFPIEVALATGFSGLGVIAALETIRDPVNA